MLRRGGKPDAVVFWRFLFQALDENNFAIDVDSQTSKHWLCGHFETVKLIKNKLKRCGFSWHAPI
jgi:hypothetical protein